MANHKFVLKGTILTVFAVFVGLLIFNKLAVDGNQDVKSRGNLELSWDAPSDSLFEEQDAKVAGYTIHCWNVENQETVEIDDPGITEYTIDELQPGTYHCAMTATQENGTESALSNAVSRIVN